MNPKERLRLFDLNHAKFKSLYKRLNLAQLSLRRATAEEEKSFAGSPVELAAKIEVLDHLIKTKEKTTRNPDYVLLKNACESLDRLDKSIQSLRKEILKAYSAIRRSRDKIGDRAEAI